jgi:hypothetical protein
MHCDDSLKKWMDERKEATKRCPQVQYVGVMLDACFNLPLPWLSAECSSRKIKDVII